ncbi:hypothetical protein DENSPDRAFT_840515 [Dentipellis sp. KUC8613]|nr:hypothetical protein DENSPDRAFT_840515 [Dentipellis sp. KUC8613]
MSSLPTVISTEVLDSSQAKWVQLKKINWKDAEGKLRSWEVAERKTRASTGVDAVAIVAKLTSKTKAFEPCTVIIEQYRAAVDKFIIELPAGLVDEGETVERAAFRELEEETGYVGDKILLESDVVVSDPGMTNANMKLVVVNVTLADKIETPKQKLDPGEAIKTRLVPLKDLFKTLKEYEQKGFVVDARLCHFAFGFQLSQQLWD